MTKGKFFICKKCGTLVGLVEKGSCTPSCCGEPMEELIANTTDAAQEKHVPVIEKNGSTITVKVGSVAHPMEAKHHISWVYLATKKGGQRKVLTPEVDSPEVTFELTADDAPVAAFAYCNLHGLWEADA